MQCPQCQAENPERARFCEDCGARLEYKCPHCGEAATPGKRFCAACGGALATAPAVSRPAPSPQDYTPQHLAARILDSRSALQGERKQVTVLFADLKGSMELLADRDPEEARAILEPVLDRMMEAVHHYEGTVNQVMGDGIMALFGAPLAHEDHAVRACYAALRMQESVKRYAEDRFRAQGIRPQIRVGLNSGEVVVGSIGSDLRMDYTAVGQTTHLAARMEQTALPGSILLAPDTLRLAEGYVQVRALGPVSIKGVDEPIEVYELLGAGLARSRLQAAVSRGLTKFVGRDAELETLRRTLEQAGAGHGQVVALVGEPGVGKSRLVWEFSHSHRTQGWLVLEAGSVSYGKATSYLPVIDLLRSYCGIESGDDARRMREKLTGKLLTLDPALQPALPALLALLDAAPDDPAWEALDPPQRRSRTLDALKRLLLRESQEQPMLLVFEDLHWIDAETQALLDGLVESLPTARVLLLVNYRPEYEHGWHRKTYYRELRLDPLLPESAEALLDALLGADASVAALKPLLVERTEGNPFFLEESVRELVEAGALVGERGAYRLARPLGATQVPATVQAVLAARIDRLAPEDKRLLQAAAVIGKDVPFPLLQAIAEEPEDRLREGLARLQAAEFLYEAALFPELEYTFKHALTHEVAYGSLLQERRRVLHARIVACIERLYADRLTEHVERLAHHAQRGALWGEAAMYAREAAVRANARSAPREALVALEQALAALRELPTTREVQQQIIDLHCDVRFAVLPLGELVRFREHLREAGTIARALDDQLRLARVLAHTANLDWWAGENARAAECGEQALATAIMHGEHELQVLVNHILGLSYYQLGDYRRSAACERRNVETLVGDRLFERLGQPHVPALIARLWAAWDLYELGEISEGLTIADEAVRLGEHVDNPFTRVTVLMGPGRLLTLQGDAQAAIPFFERALEICHERGVPVLVPITSAHLGYAYFLAGRQSEGGVLLEQALERTAAVGAGYIRARSLCWLGEIYVAASQPGRAHDAVWQALEHARLHDERGHEAYALHGLGQVAVQADPPVVEVAESYYRQALAIAEELGMRPLVAHCHLGLGTLYQKVGRAELARTELTIATDLYRAMEMPFWLQRAEAALAQVTA